MKGRLGKFGIIFLAVAVVLAVGLGLAPAVLADDNNTVTVYLQDSDKTGLPDGVVKYKLSHHSIWKPFGNTDDPVGEASMTLPSGTYDFQMTYEYAYQDISGVVHASPTEVTFTTSTVNVYLRDSDGTGLPGGVVRYKLSEYSIWRNFGNTNGNGEPEGQATKELLPGTYDFQMTYEYAYQDILGESVSVPETDIEFTTKDVTVELTKACVTGVPDVVVKYKLGEYSIWRHFGTTDSNGQVTKELLPGTYDFTVSYGGTSDTKSLTLTENGNTVEFALTEVTLQFSGSISYYSGRWRDFNSPGYLFPGTYKFSFDGHEMDINVSGCEFKKSVVVVKLLDSKGNGLAGGKVKYCHPSSWWESIGVTDANGVLVYFVDGIRKVAPFEMSYASDYVRKTQDIESDSYVVFQTAGVIVTLKDYWGQGFEGGVVKYETSSSWWAPYGITDTSGEVRKELLPKSYRFAMSYRGKSNVKTQDVGSDPTVEFTTTKVTLQFNGVIKYERVGSGWITFTQPSMDLLPGTYKFSFGGITKYIDVSGCEMGGNVVIVSLHNDGVPLNDPKYYLECSGVGKLYNDDLIFTDETTLTCRARTGNIAGPWFKFNVADSLLTHEYATVHVTLYNDKSGDDVIQDDEKLYDPHKVQVSGSGDYTTCDTFHVPPDTQISYRLHSGGVYGGWEKRMFDAGKTEWKLEFATVHVVIDGSGNVQVSGSGDYTTCDTFHVPPDTQISYRLHSGGVYDPWQKQTFPAGYTEWELGSPA